MQTFTGSRVKPELIEIVAEASRALACLDAGRLEELACCCQALTRDLSPCQELTRQAREARTDLAVFARVLDATRANLNVMRRLRELRQGLVNYGDAGGMRCHRGGADGDH